MTVKEQTEQLAVLVDLYKSLISVPSGLQDTNFIDEVKLKIQKLFQFHNLQ